MRHPKQSSTTYNFLWIIIWGVISVFIFAVISLCSSKEFSRNEKFPIARLTRTTQSNNTVIDILSTWLESEGVATDDSSPSEIRRQAAIRISTFVTIDMKTLLTYDSAQLLKVLDDHKIRKKGKAMRETTILHLDDWASWNPPEPSMSSLAFVLPFTASEISKISLWLGSLDSIPVCSKKPVPNAHFVWAYAEDFDTKEGRILQSTLMWLLKKHDLSMGCFKSHVFISLKQSKSLKHLDGACTTFFQLFELLRGQFTAIQIVETDVRAVRANWLEEYVAFADLPHACSDWWMKGSPSLCNANYAPPEPIDVKFDMHINGNALYAVSCPAFQKFLYRMQLFYPAQPLISEVKYTGGCEPGIVNEGGYDHAIFRYLHSRENFVYMRWTMPKFQYTYFVANLCEDLYDVAGLLQRERFQSTYLIHSKSALLPREASDIFDVFYKASGRSVAFNEIQNLLVAWSPKVYSGEFTKETLQLVINTPSVAESMIDDTRKLKKNSQTALQLKKSMQEKLVQVIGRGKDDDYWREAYYNQTYIWTSDLHHGPMSCQIALFRDAGAVVHPEIDFGNCMYCGFCKERLKVLSYDDWRGFALESGHRTPEEMKKLFYAEYRKDPEMQRVDVVFCSHPAANCQLYLALNKPLVVYFTTRMEFGRNDGGIFWRWPSWNEKKGKKVWQEWVKDLTAITKNKKKHLIVANNRYDVEYVKYFTGLDIDYVPSWCGDLNYAFDSIRHSDRASPYQAKPGYYPSIDAFLLGPYRTNLGLQRDGKHTSEKDHVIMQDLFAALRRDNNQTVIKTISEAFPKGYLYQDLGYYRGVVILPYQVSTMFLFELYRLNIPLFCPSKDLLIQWHRRSPDFMWERIYGWPERFPGKAKSGNDVIDTATLSADPPDPNSNTPQSFAHWIQFADWYSLPHIILFDSFEDLLHKLKTTELFEVSEKMREYNRQERERLLEYWTQHFHRLKMPWTAGLWSI
jgi:hypothetical protein